MSAAQAAQQNNRGPGGQYSFGTHAESNAVSLDAGRSGTDTEEFESAAIKARLDRDRSERVLRVLTRASFNAQVVKHFPEGTKSLIVHRWAKGYKVKGAISADGSLLPESEVKECLDPMRTTYYEFMDLPEHDRDLIMHPESSDSLGGRFEQPIRPTDAWSRPGLSVSDSVMADDIEEMDIKRQIAEMPVWVYRVDFNEDGRIEAWDGAAPCNTDNGLQSMESHPEQTTTMQAVFDANPDLTKSSARWIQNPAGRGLSFKVS